MGNKIGSIIRLNRINQGYTLRNFAEIAGIEYSQLSKIERNIESANDKIIDSIFRALNLNYIETKDFIVENIDLFDDLYRKILYKREQTVIKKKIDVYNEQVEKNFLTAENLMINIMYMLLWENKLDDVKEYLKLLDRVNSSLSLSIQQLFFQFKGYYYFLCGNLEEALKYINLANSYQINEHTSALIGYYKGMTLARLGEFFEAYEYFNKAKVSFEKYNNYVRSSICIVSIANVFLLTEYYDKALPLYFEALELFKELNMSKMNIGSIYKNIF